MKNINFLLNNLIAHRGYHNKLYPENSLPAFQNAIKHNYLIELDIHLTKDLKIVVYHDYNLQRMIKVNKIIENCNYNELIKYNLLNSKYKIPLLSEVLSLVDKKVGLLIEIKCRKFNNIFGLKLVNILDKYEGDFAIQSFNILALKWFKKNRSNYLRGLLASDFKDKKMNKIRKWICKSLIADLYLKVDFISYDLKSLPNIYVRNKRKKKPILVWTIKTIKDYEKSKKYADNYICENFEKLKIFKNNKI